VSFRRQGVFAVREFCKIDQEGTAPSEMASRSTIFGALK
jgi:hypothetical protein